MGEFRRSPGRRDGSQSFPFSRVAGPQSRGELRVIGRTQVVHRLAFCAALAVSQVLAADAFAKQTRQPTNTVAQYAVPQAELARLPALPESVSVEGRVGQALSVYVPEAERVRFEAMLPAAKLIEADVDAWMRELSPEDRAGYLEYDEYIELFDRYQQDYPNIAKVADLEWMKTENGKQILILKVTGNVDVDNEKKPNFVFTGSTHGDEWISTAVPMGILDKLLKGYGSDPRITKIVDWTVTYWIPSASPDSYHKTRNVHGLDPNRVYPYPGHDADGEIASAKNFIRWYDEMRPVGVIDFHGIQGSVLWPWGYTEKELEGDDYAHFDEICDKMVETSGYIHGPTATTIYVAKGVSLDAWWYLYGTTSLTIEIGANSKRPNESEIQRHVDANTESLWTFIEEQMPTDDPNDDTGTESGDDTTTTTDGGTDTSGDDGADEAESSGDSTGADSGDTADGGDEQSGDEAGDDGAQDSDDDDDDDDDDGADGDGAGDGADDEGEAGDETSNGESSQTDDSPKGCAAGRASAVPTLVWALLK